jgi:YHS domain-containing protein
MAKDPVCGMDVDESTAKHTTQHEGQTYYFCAPGCRKAFEADPQKYLAPGHTPSMGGHGH